MRSPCWRLPIIEHVTIQRINEFIAAGRVCRTKHVEPTGLLLTDLFDFFRVEIDRRGNNLTHEGSPGHARGLQDSLLLDRQAPELHFDELPNTRRNIESGSSCRLHLLQDRRYE